ncbi:MAG: QueT transporter family protein [Caldisericaceae bacterium]
MNQKNKLRYFVRASVIAALYFAITYFTRPISFGSVQVRIAESLTVLPFIFPEAVLGLTLGCFLANIFSPFGPIDMILGTTLTFLAAVMTMWLGKIKAPKYLAPIPPVLINGFGVSLYVVSLAGLAGNVSLRDFSKIFVNFKPLPYFAAVLSIGIGEAVAAFALGLPLLNALQRRFGNYEI